MRFTRYMLTACIVAVVCAISTFVIGSDPPRLRSKSTSSNSTELVRLFASDNLEAAIRIGESAVESRPISVGPAIDFARELLLADEESRFRGVLAEIRSRSCKEHECVSSDELAISVELDLILLRAAVPCNDSIARLETLEEKADLIPIEYRPSTALEMDRWNHPGLELRSLRLRDWRALNDEEIERVVREYFELCDAIYSPKACFSAWSRFLDSHQPPWILLPEWPKYTLDNLRPDSWSRMKPDEKVQMSRELLWTRQLFKLSSEQVEDRFGRPTRNEGGCHLYVLGPYEGRDRGLFGSDGNVYLRLDVIDGVVSRADLDHLVTPGENPCPR